MATDRSHPVRMILDEAFATRRRPDPGVLDRLGVPAKQRRSIETAAAQILAYRDEGEHGEARRLAAQAAALVAVELGGDWTPPDRKRERLASLEPNELADRVRRDY